jgi:pyrroline-5-carboxylate reductase
MMTNPPNIAFLGAGNMAQALVRGAITRGGYAPSQIAVTDVRAEARDSLHHELGVQAFASNRDACEFADVLVLAVKPQVLGHVLGEVGHHVNPKTLVISIAAGVSISRLSLLLSGHERIVRAMPNTPAMVGEGATALAKAASASEQDYEVAHKLFASTGLVVRVEEYLMDAVTGLSGSGPAYGFVAIEALSDAGVRAGLSREVAIKLAAQTLLGAAKMVLETGEHPARLKDQVTSPAGTTIAAIAALERLGFRHALMAAVEASAARSKEMGG